MKNLSFKTIFETIVLYEERTLAFARRHRVFFLILTSLFILLTFFFDNALLRRGVGLRFNWLDGVMLYLTDFGMLFFAIVIAITLLLRQKYRWLTLLAISLACSFEISYLLKLIFQTPRPYFSMEIAIIPLTRASGYAFPSLHSAFCIGIIPFIDKIYAKKHQRYFGAAIVMLIAYSRAYLGVHYISDILVGGLIGYLCSWFAIHLEFKYEFTKSFVGHVKSKLELRRQIAHLLIGMFIVFLMELRLLTPAILAVVLIVGVMISFVYRYHPIPIVKEILYCFERPKDMVTLPGKGPIFLVLGALFTMILFPPDIAKASVIVLAVGDSVSHLIGKYFGRTKVPFSKNKMLEGTIVAIACSTLCALFFVDASKAFFASLLTVSIESIYPEKFAKYIDDNLIIPLLAGTIMIML